MKKLVIIKLICIDALAILSLSLLTNACLIAAWSFKNFLSGSVYATSVNLFFKAIVTDKLVFYLFPIFALLFSWGVLRFCNFQKKRWPLVLNAFVFLIVVCVIYVLLLNHGQASFIGHLLFPQDGFSLITGAIIITIVQIIVVFLFNKKRDS